MTIAQILKSPFGVILLVMMICLIGNASGLAMEGTRVRWIGIDELDKVVEKQNPVIVDLRTSREYERGHIPGALNIPIEVLRADRSVLDRYKETPVLLYCRTINKTDLALWFLENRGFKSIYALRGGYEAYRLYDR